MSIRLLAFALLAGASIAAAAPRGSSRPPKTEPAPQQAPESIDVDAMARAKDADAAADAPPPAASASDAASDAPVQEALPAQAVPADVPSPPASGETSSDAPSTPENATAAMEASPEGASAPAEAAAQTQTAPSDAPEADASPAAPAQSDASQMQPDASQPGAAPDAAERRFAAGCESRAAGLLDDAEKADYGKATRDFDAKMRSELPAPRFQQQWESLGQFGKLVARGQSHLGRGEGYTIVVIPLIFEKANLVAQIACGSDGRIAGFHVTQAPKPQF
ncbi:MAG TPA: DUF3887 domain-containing protein [Rhodanobacteraceae bacterium]|nr:DUF3887 domain-containing protein [Rhodanobacteraceae bacterium]